MGEMFSFFRNFQAGRVGKNMGTEAVRTRKLITELDAQFPHLKAPNIMDPALRSLLEQKVQDGRMTQAEFEAEISTYEPEQK